MIIFVGVAGSGKSIQGRMLADELGLAWLSTGEFLRMLVTGQQRKAMISGKLLSDKEIISLLGRILAFIEKDKEFVLDGFPRSVAQADWLLNQVKHGQLKITAVINLKADEKTVKERLLARGRHDDTNEAIKKRFKEYESVFKPILSHFKAYGIPVFDVDGSGRIDKVHAEILKIIKKTK